MKKNIYLTISFLVLSIFDFVVISIDFRDRASAGASAGGRAGAEPGAGRPQGIKNVHGAQKKL